MSDTALILCKNTDRHQRPVDLTGGGLLAPADIGEVPDDAHTADLLANGRLTRVPSDIDGVPAGSIETVENWVAGDKDRAQQALDVELASKRPRSTLVDTLQQLITSEES